MRGLVSSFFVCVAFFLKKVVFNIVPLFVAYDVGILVVFDNLYNSLVFRGII